ncbi:membrane protease YdiL (CAAX protease family) [Tumebacillus sp. BK434]|uniref:CPBP family glutamic-type intramembrane protease n=1 Tax=Tumebacillus sp. BK434 TaxID=2512169 RepID=UPI001049CDF2|nr:type II CAAX endopeptidase family protein [Tumebacillus sp. BK434]TCP57792.1 membrane protease YdiL (CAAX protease family) [Tumebacillus sp. BK434]
MGVKKRGDRMLWMIGIVGLVMYFVFSWQDLFAAQEWKMLSRDEVIAKAQTHWKQENINLSEYKTSAVMESADSLDGYLGKEDLHEEFGKQAPDTAPVTYWHVIFYNDYSSRGLTYETYHDVKSGKLIGFSRPTPETNTEISTTAGRQRAEQALQDLGVDMSRLELLSTDGEIIDEAEVLEGDEEYRSNRMSFSWQDRSYQVGDSELYYEVSLTGDQVDEVTSDYRVPDSFTEWHDRQTLYAGLLTGVSLLGSFLLLVFAFVFLFLIQQKRPYWSSLWLSLLVFVLYAISNVNQWPVLRAQALGEGGGMFGLLLTGALAIVMAVITSFWVGASNYPLTMTGGMLVREVKPSLWLNRRDPEWSDRMRSAAKRGYALAFAWMGFQGLFYFIGENYFGVWYENDLSMSPANMWVPALFPLLAWFAGISEEITYRLFGVTFLKRYLKYSFIAALLPAMVWALGHTLYPIYPIYTRFIELTIFGVIIGYCYLHYGLETVIFAHVTFDTVLMCIPLFLSGEAVQVASATFFLFLPLVVGYGVSLMKMRREQSDFA